jgi:hypothetical protein
VRAYASTVRLILSDHCAGLQRNRHRAAFICCCSRPIGDHWRGAIEGGGGAKIVFRSGRTTPAQVLCENHRYGSISPRAKAPLVPPSPHERLAVPCFAIALIAAWTPPKLPHMRLFSTWRYHRPPARLLPVIERNRRTILSASMSSDDWSDTFSTMR